MTVKEIALKIQADHPDLTSIFFVGCGASMSELFPAKYFLDANARRLRIAIYTANEFIYSTPVSVNEKALVICCSLSGNTPETTAAAKKAMKLGAAVVSVTHVDGSPLALASHYQIIHGFDKNYAAKAEKMTNALALACEILNACEGYEYYDDFQTGIDKIYDLIEQAAAIIEPSAKAFAEAYKKVPILYVTGSGASQLVAYSFSMFLMMEMQWIPSVSFHDGEYFHGPFELTEKGVPYLLLMNDGPTRPMDIRALTFLRRMDAKVTVVDAKDFGLGSRIPSTVVEYFNPMLIGGILRVYAEQMAIVRSHPLTRRRYMWKLEY